MVKAWTQFRLELRLLFGTYLLLLLPILFGLWMVSKLSNLNPDVSQDLYMYTYDFHKVQHTLSLGVAMLVGILLVRRDLRRPSYEWSVSFPVSSIVYTGSKLTAGLLYMSLYTVAMSAVYVGFAAGQHLPSEAIYKELLFFIGQYEWSYAVTLALAVFLAIWIPNRIVYLIGLCGWIFGTFFLDIFLVVRQEWFFLKAFHLSQFTLDSLYANEAWGPWVTAQERASSRLVTAGFIMLLVALGIYLLKISRPSRTRRVWGYVAAAALILFIAASGFYGSSWQQRYAATAEKKKTAPTREIYEQMRQISFPVSSYDIIVKQNPDDRLELKAELKLPTSELPLSTDVPFTLNPSFTVLEVTVNGTKVDFNREGEFVRLHGSTFDPKLKEQLLAISYQGKLFDWMPVQQKEVIGSMVQGDKVVLPESQAWYPLPGNRYLYGRQAGKLLQAHGNFYASSLADFSVRLQDFQGNVYATASKASGNAAQEQIFEARQAFGVSLFAGDLMEITGGTDPLRMVTTPGNLQEAGRFMTDIAKQLAYFRSWLPLPSTQGKSVYYWSMEHLGDSSYEHMQAALGPVYQIAETRNHNLDYVQYTYTLNWLLYGDDDVNSSYYRTDESNKVSLVGEVRKAIRYLYYVEMKHENQATLKKQPFQSSFLLPFTGRGGEENSDGIRMFTMIDKAIIEGRVDQVKQVLAAFYRQGLGYVKVGNTQPQEYPIITFADWTREWNRVFGS